MQAAPAIAKDVERFLTSLARSIRARGLYAANNEALHLMEQDLWKNATLVFRQLRDLSLTVRPDALLFEEAIVFENPPDQDDISFLLYRDGVRKLDLLQGLTRDELNVLVDALHAGRGGRTLEDDVVAHLWRRELEHIRYVTVDVHVTDAAEEGAQQQQVEAVVRSLYGAAPEGSVFHGIHLDASEEAAKVLADALGRLDEMAPGFRPMARLPDLPAYAGRLKSHVDPDPPSRRMVRDIVAMLADASEEDAQAGFESMLELFDAALGEADLELATEIVVAIRAIRDRSREVEAWMGQAVSDVRLRQVSAICESDPTRESEVVEFFRACGSRASATLVLALGLFRQPGVRRRFADLAVELGGDFQRQAEELLRNEQGFVAREGIYLLSRLDQLRNRHVLRDIQRHPKPQVRLELLQEIDRVPDDIASSVVADLLRDEEPRVRVAAAETLGMRGDESACRALAYACDRPDFDEESPTVKQAIALAVASTLGRDGIPYLEPLTSRAEGWMAKKGSEETALAAVKALGQIRHPDAVVALKGVMQLRNRSVRDAAREALMRMGGQE
ncbi:MAG: HEAT repeat domain-containing protein [Myxococcota bacterium]